MFGGAVAHTLITPLITCYGSFRLLGNINPPNPDLTDEVAGRIRTGHSVDNYNLGDVALALPFETEPCLVIMNRVVTTDVRLMVRGCLIEDEVYSILLMRERLGLMYWRILVAPRASSNR